MTANDAPRTSKPRSAPGERALALGLRALHLVAVVALGAALLGAPLSRPAAASAVFASGLALALLDLLARRIAWRELAGVVVLVKLAAMAWVALASQAPAQAVFWVLVVLSALSSHAPRRWRHHRLVGPPPASASE